MQTFKTLSLTALTIGAIGCGGPGAQALGDMEPAPLTSSTEVRDLASVASALKMYALVINISGTGDEPEGNCPVVTVNGNSTTYTGGCTDEDGVRYFGEFVDTRDAVGSITGTVQFNGYGAEATEECANGQTFLNRTVVDGTLKRGGTATAGNFELDAVLSLTEATDTCVPNTVRVAADYRGEVDRGLPSSRDLLSRATWNGKGRIGMDGLGKADVETVDEVMDSSVCGFEALSGSTTIKSGKDVAVISYDGASQCSFSSTATWTLNGTAQGSMDGVGCSAVGTGAMSAWGLVALGGLLLRRRRQQ